jgi:hypothetical protein
MEELLIEHLITKTVIAIFNGSDKHQWDVVRHSLADDVLLDYSSLSGHPAAQTKADDIIADWSDFLPKFTFTCDCYRAEVRYSCNHENCKFDFQFSSLESKVAQQFGYLKETGIK